MTDTSDIGGSYSQVNGNNFVVPPSSTTPTNAPTNPGFSQTDTISAADLAASLAMLLSITPQTPILPPPNPNQQTTTTGIIPVGITILNLAAQYHKICMNVLDSWSESIKKIAEDAKEAEKSPAHLAKTETERQQRLGLVDSVKTYADKLEFEKNDGMLGSLTNALIITGAFTGVAVATNIGSIVGAIPQIGFAVGFAAKSLMPVSQDVRGQLGLVGAWAMGALINYSVIEAVTGKSGDKPIDEKLLADKYGEKMLKLLNSPQLNNFITAMLANKLENGKPLSDGRKEELSATLKTVILASALAAVYKSKTGAITAQEFTDLATGKMTPEDGVEKQLVEAIKEQIASMSVDERPQILKAIGSYMDEDPKLKEFFNVGNAFDHVNDALVNPQVKS